MTETTVPETGNETSKMRRRDEQIDIAKPITSHERNPCLKTSDRKTKWIKGNKNVIVSSEL